MDEGRSEEARASGLLHLAIGGEAVELPVLRIRKAREWKRLLADIRSPDVEGMDPDVDHPVETMLDLLVAYDVTGVLGGRERLEDRATDREIYAAFREVLEATFPFVEDSGTMMAEDFTRAAIAILFLRASSTSTPSPIGASPPTPSRRHSRKSSSSSSGTPAASDA